MDHNVLAKQANTSSAACFGAITDTDVGLAEASNAPIIGFNVRANASARASANQKGVEIRYYSVIYDMIDDVKAAASGLLSNEIREHFIGYASIKEVFKVTGVGKVAEIGRAHV